MNRWIVLLTTLALLAPLQAQAAESGIELTLFAGYRSGQDFDLGDDTTLRIDDGETFGLGLGIPLGDALSIEVRYSQQSAGLIEEHDSAQPDEDLGDLDISHALAGLTYSWNRGTIHPYAGFGLGVARFEEGDFSSDHFAASLQAGARLFVTDHVGFRFEGRYLWTEGKDDILNGDAFSSVEATAGVAFRF
jgi:opacity protein-like surface antigen